MDVSEGAGTLAQAAADVALVEATTNITVIGGAVTAVSLGSGGSGYQAVGSFQFTLSPGSGGGTGAVVQATVTGGAITAVSLVSGGSGYSTPSFSVRIPDVVTPQPVNVLEATGGTVVSPFTGETRTIRHFTATTLGSGVFMIFKNDGSGPPFQYINNANPNPVTADYRFDQCEITFNATIQSGANLTSIDALSMPMMFELFDGSMNKVGERRYYESLSTILSQFPASASDALYENVGGTPTQGWDNTLGSQDFATFLRALGPGKVASTNVAGDPAPYPSFKPYLEALLAAKPSAAASGTATLVGGLVTSVSLQNAGSGYVTPPSITFSGGGAGSGAAATATLNAGGQVESVSLTSMGSGYSSPPSVTFSAAPGGGTTATGVAIVETGVQSVTVGSGGAGYVYPPAVTLTGGGGSGATAVATVSGGVVTSVQVTKKGSGYSSAPTVSFNQFGVAGSSNGIDYNYSGDIETATNGYQIVLNGTTYRTGTTTPDAGSGTAGVLPISAQVTVNLPETLEQASYTANVDVSGAVTGFTKVSEGNGYMSTPIVTVAGPTAGTTAKATAAAPVGTQIPSLNLTGGGSGYSSASPPVVTVDPPAGSLDTFIYGATLSGDSFALAGFTPAQIQEDTNIVYGSITRDVLAALNFGFANGTHGNTTSQWYSSIPLDSPYGLARPTSDGFYNTWSALIYNYSDAYGFAFGDRVEPSPLITLEDGYTLRITLLPDAWLNAPIPKITSVTPTTMQVQWNGVETAGFTGITYSVDVLDHTGVTPPTITSSGNSYSAAFTGLSEGTTYTFAVTASGTTSPGGQSVSSVSVPVQEITTGTVTPQSEAIPFLMTVTFPPPSNLFVGGPPTAKIDGVDISWDTNTGSWTSANVSGKLGENSYPVTMKDSGGNIIFSTTANVNLTASSGTITTDADCSYFEDGRVSVAGAGSGTLVALILPPLSPVKEFAPITFTTQSYANWIATFPGITDPAQDGDPDSDTLNNLREYFQNMDPEIAGLLDSVTVDRAHGFFTLSYRKSKTVENVTETVEWSTDLLTWQTTDVTYDPDEDKGSYILRTARVPDLDDAKLFMRLELKETLDEL